MGKPAARITDMTAHGGVISGPGIPNVLIGKLPAATLGDMHVCPMVTPGTPPIPHVGGPITLGSTGVFIGKKPAARMGDMCVCVGPPATILKGEFTVLIGEAGGGGGGSAAAAALAKSASLKGIQPMTPMSVEAPKNQASQNHEIHIQFVDKANRPVGAVAYKIKDPDAKELVATSTMQGLGYHGGYAKAGSFQVIPIGLSQPKWSSNTIEADKPVKLSVKVEGTEEGIVQFAVLAHATDTSEQFVYHSQSSIKSGKSEIEYCFESSAIETLCAGTEKQFNKLSFFAFLEGQLALSSQVDLVGDYQIEMLSQEQRPIKNEDVVISFGDGQKKIVKTDTNGIAQMKAMPIGIVKTSIPGIETQDMGEANEKSNESNSSERSLGKKEGKQTKNGLVENSKVNNENKYSGQSEAEKAEIVKKYEKKWFDFEYSQAARKDCSGFCSDIKFGVIDKWYTGAVQNHLRESLPNSDTHQFVTWDKTRTNEIVGHMGIVFKDEIVHFQNYLNPTTKSRTSREDFKKLAVRYSNRGGSRPKYYDTGDLNAD